MNTLKCKNYFIFDLRYYADKRLLTRRRLLGEEVFPPQHMQRAVLSNDFFWGLVEKVTGKKQDYWYKSYMYSTVECVLEEIEETHDIHRWLFRDGCYTYFIPHKHVEIIEWIKQNIKSPYKIKKKSSSGHISLIKTYHRDTSKIDTDKFKHKIFIAENTRIILIEKNENMLFLARLEPKSNQ